MTEYKLIELGQDALKAGLYGPRKLSGPDSYLLSLRSANSERTMKSALNRIARMLGMRSYEYVPFDNFKTKHVNKIIEMLCDDEKKLHPDTINLYLSALKGVFKHCWECGEMAYEEYLKLKSVKELKAKRIKKSRVVIRPEIEGLIDFCEQGKTNKCLRDAAIVGVLAGCGLRREEISGLNLEDINFAESVFLVRGKGNKERETPIPPTTMERINRWLVIRGNQKGPLFVRVHRSGSISSSLSGISGQAIYNILRERCEEVKYESIHPHAMRHYFATNLLRNGVDIKTVMEMLGHESITTTQSYIDKNKEEERKAAIIADI
jgi:site-specific recombinase XerD